MSIRKLFNLLKSPVRPSKRRSKICCHDTEQLEYRRVPVVFAWPTIGVDYSGISETGVVKLDSSLTGTLLSSGRHVLTAAHGLTDSAGRINSASITVTFERQVAGNMEQDTMEVPASAFRVHPGWDGWNRDSEYENDVAILQLPELAPYWATRHDLYRNTNEIGQTGIVVGYGQRGNGVDGEITGTFGTKLKGTNYIEFDDYDPGIFVAGSPGPAGTTLAIDLTDNPSLKREAIGAHGDSGGPLLIGNQIAGVYSTLWGEDEAIFDFDYEPNADLDDVGVYMRASYFAPWIDSIVATAHPLGLDLNSFSFANDGVNDSISVFRTGDRFVFLNGSTTFYSVLVSQVLSLSIQGTDDSESFSLPMDLGIAASVNGGSGTNTLATRGVSAWSVSNTPFTVQVGGGSVLYQWTGAPIPSRRTVTYSSISGLTVNTGNGKDDVLVQATVDDPVLVINTLGEQDHLQVSKTGLQSVTLNGGDGDDTFRIGALHRTFDELRTSVTVTGNGGANKMIIDDSRDETKNSYVVSSLSVTRGFQRIVNYSGIVSLELRAGKNDDTVNIGPADSITSLLVDGGAGNDGISVRLNKIRAITAIAGLGGGKLTLDNQINAFGVTSEGRYTATDSQVSVGEWRPSLKGGFVVPIATVSHSGFQALTLNTGFEDDLIRVQTNAAAGIQTTVNAGMGNDIIVGGSGSDILNGMIGRDILIGGDGIDTLSGGFGEDILIADRYTKSNSDLELLALRTLWTSSRSYASRIADLRPKLNTSTITSDTIVDGLFGNGDLDWFWGVNTGLRLGEVRDRETIGGQLEVVR